MAEFNIKEEIESVKSINDASYDFDGEAEKIKSAFHNGDCDIADAYRVSKLLVEKAEELGTKASAAQEFRAEAGQVIADVVVTNNIDFNYPAML